MRRHFTLALCVTALLLTVGLSACASTERSADATTTAWSRSTLVGTTWSELCPGGDPERTFLELRDDGTFAYRYAADPTDGWSHDGTERWEVRDGELVISWSDGYAVTRYRLDASKRLPGESTKRCKPFTLEYVGPER